MVIIILINKIQYNFNYFNQKAIMYKFFKIKDNFSETLYVKLFFNIIKLTI